MKSFNRSALGRPRIEVDQPELLSAIVDIVSASSATDDRRHCEQLRTVKTLDDLVGELKKKGFTLSRSATYLRLVPRRGNTSEGKRHVQTVPVKLLRPENNLRNKNPDRMFAKSSVDDMFDVAKYFGPEAVNFLSNDDKAKVPLGLAAATLQAPLLMHLEYKVTLPDHNFVVAPAHKLIPSVYAVCNVSEKGEVQFSGNTFVRIRDGKHDTSNAATHAYDLIELFDHKEIPSKPILLIESDGAQDEAPRFPKPLANAVYLFQRYDLDTLIHTVNAAGLSAFNPCERRMAPLSHDVAGVVLPHDTFGSHLDRQRRTVDEELEKANFFAASEELASIWSKTVIDGHPVDARAVPLGQQFVAPTPDPKWVSIHVQQTRYHLQVVKCTDRSCCSDFKTDWIQVFPDRFLPAPAVYQYGIQGLQAVEPSECFANPKISQFSPLHQRLRSVKLPQEAAKYVKAPYDLYCPSMAKKLTEGICKKCHSYWPSAAAMKRHRKCHSPASLEEIESDDQNVEDDVKQDTLDTKCPEQMPIFNIFELLENPEFSEDIY